MLKWNKHVQILGKASNRFLRCCPWRVLSMVYISMLREKNGNVLRIRWHLTTLWKWRWLFMISKSSTYFFKQMMNWSQEARLQIKVLDSYWVIQKTISFSLEMCIQMYNMNMKQQILVSINSVYNWQRWLSHQASVKLKLVSLSTLSSIEVSNKMIC